MFIPAPFDLFLDCAFLVSMLQIFFFFFNLWVIDLYIDINHVRCQNSCKLVLKPQLVAA